MKITRLAGLVATVITAGTSLVLMSPAVAAEGAGTTTSGGATTCWVKNVRTGETGTDLQTAVGSAVSGDTLRLAGACGAVEIGTSLKLVGPASISRPICEQCGSGTMVIVRAGAVATFKDLTVTGGFSSWDAGGVLNEGTLVLNGHSKVTGNQAEDNAAGIDNYGTLVMNDYSSVADNSLYYRGDGGGIRNLGTLYLNGSSVVSGNSASRGGGVFNSGKVVLRGYAKVTLNSAETGGGVYNTDTGTLVLSGASKIVKNSASGYYDDSTGELISTGGGVFNGGTVRIDRYWSGTVRWNTPDNWDQPAAS